MADEAPARVEEMEDQDQDQEAPPVPDPAAPDPKQDDVKPVVFIGLFLTALFVMGGVDLLWGVEDNGCKMTYMFEYPQYIQLAMPDHISSLFPKYGLYAYGEGEGKSVERLKTEKFSGIPVIFIPGNSGSHKQVRSLASVALRMAIKKTEYKVHFDYFSVDFDEEHSAFYGGALEGQVEFVSAAVSRILALYKGGKNTAPSSVVLVGHSLGGVIAKALFTLPGFQASQVSVLLTLATPHHPVLLMDKQSDDFYKRVSSHWHLHREKDLAHVTLASIGGGLRDVQVRAGLTNDTHADLNIVSSAVPGVWVSTDHRCIVWCKQLVLQLNRALFDMIGPVSKQITASPSVRRSVLHHHLLEGSGGQPYSEDRHPATVTMDKNGYWSDILKRQFTVTKGNITCEHYMMVKLNTDDAKQRFLTLEAVRMESDDWVFGCKETVVHRNTRVCTQGDNLSARSLVLPGKGHRRAVHLDLLEARRAGYTHVVVSAPAGSEDTRVHVDVYNPRERRVIYSVPKWITFWREFPMVEATVPGAVFYNITLTGMENPWQAYTVRAEPLQCAALEEGQKQHYGIIRFLTPWALDTTQAMLGLGGNFTNSLTAKLQSARPQGSNDTAESPMVHLYLDPACTYRISVRATFPGIMGQLVRFHLPMVLPCMAAALIMVLAFQLRRIEQDGTVKSTLLTLASCVSPVNVVLPSRLVAYVAALGPLAALLPATDIHTLQAGNLDFGLLPIMMFFLAIGLTLALSALAWLAVVLLGTAAHKAVLKMAETHEAVADVAISSLQRFPSLLAVLLIAVAWATCGSMALCIGCLAYFLKLAKMYEDYLQSLVKRAVGLVEEDDSELLVGLHFQLTLALLWTVVSCLNLPTLMAWTQNLPHGVGLPADPSLLHATVLSACLAVLWQNDGKPRVEKKFYSGMAVVLQATAIFIGSFALVTMYRVSFAVSAVFVVLSSHQLVAPSKVEEREERLSVSEEEEAEALAETRGQGAKEDDDGEEGLDWEYEELPEVDTGKGET